jgi:phosphatidate cytidylyltransferase
MVLSIGVGLCISHFKYSGTWFDNLLWIILAIMVSIFGTMGDLVESAFKRSINVKESGTLLPGHGGILDRFDGVFLSTPFVIAFLYVIYVMEAVSL